MRDARAHHTDNLLTILLGTVNPRDAPSIKDRHRVPVPDSRVLTLPPSRSAVIALYLSPLAGIRPAQGLQTYVPKDIADPITPIGSDNRSAVCTPPRRRCLRWVNCGRSPDNPDLCRMRTRLIFALP